MPGIDITDFFNYGFTPDTWKEYCAEVHQFRVEFSMQKKISTMGGVAAAPPVFVDPDLPPELRAAVAAQRMGGVPQPMAPFAVRWVREWRGCGDGPRDWPPCAHVALPLTLSTVCRAVPRRLHMRRRLVAKVRRAWKCAKEAG